MGKSDDFKHAAHKLSGALSFISGLVIASVAIGVVVANNAEIRAELERQAKQFLRTTGSLLSRYQGLARKLQRLGGEQDEAEKSSEQASKQAEYEKQWQD